MFPQPAFPDAASGATAPARSAATRPILAVTRPQTRDGVVDRFRTDLADAVAYAQEQTGSAESTAIYGGIPGGLTADVSTFIESVMEQIMDAHQSVPAPR